MDILKEFENELDQRIQEEYADRYRSGRVPPKDLDHIKRIIIQRFARDVYERFKK